jgi:hypothetical protein
VYGAKKKRHVELIFLDVGILQLDGDAREGGFCAFGVQRKIIIGVLTGGAWERASYEE